MFSSVFSKQQPSRLCQLFLLGAALGSLTAAKLFATDVYATNSATGQLQAITGGSTTTVLTDPNLPEGLVFTNPNNIVYTTTTTGTLDDYNLATHTRTVLDTFGVNQRGSYLVLDPGGNSVTFGITGVGIDRYNLNTHTLTNISNFSDPRGLAYDANGDLFAVLGPTQLAQINPLTGVIIKNIILPNSGSAGADGLAFDAATGELFVEDLTNDVSARGLYEIPATLTSDKLVSGGLYGYGITGDGKGDLWIAALNNLDEYNTRTGTLTAGAYDPGIFDVALAPGKAGSSNTPEPSSLLLIGAGLLAAGVLRRNKSKLPLRINAQ